MSDGDNIRHIMPPDPFDVETITPDDPVAESERAVLGSVIQSSAAAQEAAAILNPEHFARLAHETVFRTALALADAGLEVEPAMVISELAAAGKLTKVGDRDLGTGGVFLHSLMQRAGSVSYHAPKVLAAWQQRNVALVLKSCEGIADGPGFDPDIHLDQIRKLIEDATAFTGPSALRPNSETVCEVLGTLEDGTETGLPTGYSDLDDVIGGLRPGELIVVGARPGGGKSLIALCIADHVGTRLNLPVLFSSLEMREEELTQRRISALSRVPLHNIVRHQVTEADWDRINRAQDRLMATQLHIDDTPQVSLAHIRSQLRAMARTGSAPRLLVIDYLGYMAAPKAESRQQAVAELARGAKNIAREFNIPVILLAQLNRGSESRSDKRPGSSDLRESGEIEQSADIVLLLHREDAYERESPRAGELDAIITKNRQGPLCTVTLLFQGHYGRIVSFAPRDSDPDQEWSPSRGGE